MREVLNEPPSKERGFKLPQTFLITICFAIQNALSYIGASIMQGVVHTLTLQSDRAGQNLLSMEKIKNEPSA